MMNHLQNFDLNVDCPIEEDEGEDTIHLRHNTCDSDDEFDIDLENDNPSPNQEIDEDFYFDNDDGEGEGDQMLNVVLDEKETTPLYIGWCLDPLMSAKNKKTILENDMAGVPIAKNYNSIVVKYGGHDNVPFDERDCRNLISKNRRLSSQQGDFEAMRRNFCEMISSNSNFFYMYDIDENGSLKNVFWADGRSRATYMDVRDVVSFDTTYVSNRYRMPFAPFIGVNNHGQSILFGCALLAGEEVANFVWLFDTWLACMSDKVPKGILTDQCKSIGRAVKEVFPHIEHRCYIWHIMRNAKNI
ncbi:hypothetical protein QQ045_019267 [Rhodiola kirilowii]